LGGASQLAILHDRTLYFLRQTRYGKLILTK
jgi:hemin uptake protein HemP